MTPNHAPSPADALRRLKIPEAAGGVGIGPESRPGRGPAMEVRSPIDGRGLARVATATPDDLRAAVDAAADAFLAWRTVPAPARGEFVRRVGQRLRDRKTDLAQLVSWEAGKIAQEALGEV